MNSLKEIADAQKREALSVAAMRAFIQSGLYHGRPDEIARMAYEQADAMMAQGEKSKDGAK